ncbi:metallophosphoesterase [Pseudoduganella sp. SL102]|uniref:metallophosphoesterase n=1 Tax=Pseudoduganella sp. SL102 TaxID=2995154 RepID=UPI00248BAC9E|nr:metallophosphoesterase [Pseudoduganella sp. SL102]WBS04093.1 metallophosphoesterase [Pseudoduganella sp. SL102]
MTSFVRRVNANQVGRDFVVGDVHGCFSELQAELDRLKFNGDVDRLFSVGDLVDRGPESAAVAEWLTRPWFYAVRGNHEQMALDYLVGDLDYLDYQQNGGAWFLELDLPNQESIAAQFDALPVVLEIETWSGLVGIVHGDCPFASWEALIWELESDDAPQVADTCLYSRKRITEMDDSGVAGVSKIFVGHTPVPRPIVLGNVHYIDTGAVFGNRLTIARLNGGTPRGHRNLL